MKRNDVYSLIIHENKSSYSIDDENIYAIYNGSYAKDEDPADYIRPIKAVRVG